MGEGPDPIEAPDGARGERRRSSRRPLTVLAVLPGITPDAGTEQSFMAVAPVLLEAGVTIHLVVLTTRQSLVPTLESLGVVVHDLSSITGTPKRARALRKLIEQLHPDVVHASLHEATLPAQVAVVRTGTPIVVTWANTNYGEGRREEPGVDPWKLGALRWIEAGLGRASKSWYQAVTPAVGRINGQAVHAPRDHILLGERGRDPDLFPYRGEQPVSRPDDLPVDTASRLILAIGRQEPQKDYPLLLRSFDRLAERRDDVELVIAGRVGSSSRRIDELRDSLASRDRIHLIGQRDDVADLLRAADVVVCSSRREGAAGALIEAMACGAPVVSVPVAGLEGVLIDGRNSLLVPRESLDYGIERVLNEPELARRLSVNGRASFEERFTIDAAADQMLRIYRAVAGSTWGRDPAPELVVT